MMGQSLLTSANTRLSAGFFVSLICTDQGRHNQTIGFLEPLRAADL